MTADQKSDQQLKKACIILLARLYFSAEELLLYPRRPCRRPRQPPHAKSWGKC